MSREAAFWALVPAAGSGQRFGSTRPKQYQCFAGRPLLWHTLTRVLQWPVLSGVVVAVAPTDTRWQALAETLPEGACELSAVTGGDDRHASVVNGLLALRQAGARNGDWVMVHDAARPGVRKADVERLMAHCRQTGEGGLLAVAARDTLQESDDGVRVTGTLDRSRIFQAQTPQCFRLGDLLAVLTTAAARGDTVTDEAGAMTAAGHAVHLLPGHWQNFKLTIAGDGPLMHWILTHDH